MALRPPCPHKIVFEGKLFRARGIPAAEKALVTGIYEVFFYRGLPPIEESEKHPAWDYDYGCLLAYDATPEGTLKDAWESLSSAVKDACWDGASVYVMILRGKAS
jgi:hypothetical protein